LRKVTCNLRHPVGLDFTNKGVRRNPETHAFQGGFTARFGISRFPPPPPLIPLGEGSDLRPAESPKHLHFKWVSPHVWVFRDSTLPQPPSPQGMGRDLGSAGIPKHTRFKGFSPDVLVFQDGGTQIRLKSRNTRISSGFRHMFWCVEISTSLLQWVFATL